MRSHKHTRVGGLAVAVAMVVAGLLAGAPSAQRVHADGGAQNHPADVFVINWQYIPDTFHVKHGHTFKFGNYDIIFGNPGHSLTEVVKDCTAAPFNGNNPGKGNCSYPRFSSGFTDWTYVNEVHNVDKLAPGTYAFTCQVHPFMRGTLVVDP
jgi:plastocyanin